MQNNPLFAFFVFFLFLVSCKGAETPQMTKDEVIGSFYYSVDEQTPEEFKNYLKLLDAGEAAYPALVEILSETNDRGMVSNIITVFIQSKGNKTIPLQAMTQYLELHAREESAQGEVRYAVSALGDLGGSQEAIALRKLLDTDVVLTRDAVEAALEKIETRQKAGERQAASQRRSKGRKEQQVSQVTGTDHGEASERMSKSGFFRSYWRWLLGIVLLPTAWMSYRHFLVSKSKP